MATKYPLVLDGTALEELQSGDTIADVVYGPATATDGAFVLYDGTTGKLVQDGPSPPSGDLVGTTATQTLTNKTLTSPIVANMQLTRARETVTISATAATGTIQYDVITQVILYYTSDATGNWTLNIRGDGSNTLNTLMSVGQTMVVAFLATNGATGYYQNGFQIDGVSVTPKWQGDLTPTVGNINSIDAYTFTIIKTADATYTVLGTFSQFA